MSGAVQDHASTIRPSPLACTECRNKHLKCDAKLPACSRCAASNLSCNYTPSRRGCKGVPKKRRKLNSTASQDEAPPAVGDQVDSTTFEPPATTSADGQQHSAFSAEFLGIRSEAPEDSLTAYISDYLPPDPDLDDEHIISLYYTNFHPAHPVLVPRKFYSDQSYPRYLKLVVHFIGSRYSTSAPNEDLRLLTSRALIYESQRTPHMVQAMLLFAIAIHAQNEPSEARATLSHAVDLATSLNMNSKDFAVNHGGQQWVNEESLRRTWWELYVSDGFLSAIHRKTACKSNSVPLNTPLPCEESAYSEGVCTSNSLSLVEFTERHFADEELSFSSFCYRIEAVQILSRVLSISRIDVHADKVQAVDNSLAAWSHYLPRDKREVIDNFGLLDEMLFQAHMIISCATILLHLPRSDLLTVLPATSEIFCACAKGDKAVSPTDSKHTHAVKATDASKELTNLAALRCPVQKHSPFFICALVLASTVQLSACTLHACRCYEEHRDRITLIVGLLRSLSLNWAMAGSVMQKIKRVAAKVLKPHTGESRSQCEGCTDGGLGVPGEDMQAPWLEFFDDSTLAALTQFAPGMIFPNGDESVK